MANFLRCVYSTLKHVEEHLVHALRRRSPPAYAINVVALEATCTSQSRKTLSIADIMNEAFLFAVPKHRRSIEKRLKRKFGDPQYIQKILLPKTNLRVCNVCGDDHEVGKLCPSCYSRIIEETKLMQAKIQAELKLEPVENEVVVLYEGERNNKPAEFWQGKRVIEMDTARPAWFSENLTEKSTQQPASTKDVKPNQLG